MHDLRGCQHLDAGRKLVAVQALFDPQQRLDGGLHEAAEDHPRLVQITVPRARDAFGIGQARSKQPFAEHLLQVGKALEPQLFGKAGDRRGRDIRQFRQPYKGGDCHFLWVIQEKLGDLRQPF